MSVEQRSMDQDDRSPKLASDVEKSGSRKEERLSRWNVRGGIRDEIRSRYWNHQIMTRKSGGVVMRAGLEPELARIPFASLLSLFRVPERRGARAPSEQRF